MNIVIIEDEKLLQEELTVQLQQLEPVEIVACLSTVSASVSWLQQHQQEADLIFMDIELADGVSFEIFESVEVTTPIIFLTAYSEYTLQAFKVNSIDYLLKPVQSKELAFALQQFKQSTTPAPTHDFELLKQLYAPVSPTIQRILVQSGDTFRSVDIQEIAYFIAEDKYTTIVTFDQTKYVIDDTLSRLDEQLPGDSFFRPTRKYIVHIKAIIKAAKYFNNRLKLEVSPALQEEILVSRSRVRDFLIWMGQ